MTLNLSVSNPEFFFLKKKISEDMSRLRLKQVHVLFRHGDRTPGFNGLEPLQPDAALEVAAWWRELLQKSEMSAVRFFFRRRRQHPSRNHLHTHTDATSLSCTISGWYIFRASRSFHGCVWFTYQQRQTTDVGVGSRTSKSFRGGWSV